MTQEELREFEHKMHEETNEKVMAGAEASAVATGEPGESKPVEEGKEASEEAEKKEENPGEEAAAAGYGNPVAAVASGVKSWFSWS